MSNKKRTGFDNSNAPKSTVMEKKYKLWELLLPPSILSILTTIFYWPSLKYPFQFDDIAHITKNFSIRQYTSWSIASLFHPRWFADWLNKINYKMGEFNPFPFRCTNLMIHILSGIALFTVIYLLLSRLKKNEFLQKNSLIIASITTALFLLHPVQTQLVSYVIQARLEGLATLFVLLSMLTIILIARSTNTGAKILLSILLIFFSLISCSTKEIVIIAPFLALTLDWFLIAEQSWEDFKTRIWLHVLFSVLVFGSYLYYQNVQWFVQIFSLKLTASNNRGNILTQSATQMITPMHYLISEFKVILHYLFIFIWPFGISVEYDWKLASGFFAMDSFFPFLALAAIGFTVIKLALKKQFEYLTFGLIWFFITIAPRSSIIPSAELICDYKTYLASVGWLLIFAVVITKGINYLYEKISINPNFATILAKTTLSKEQNKIILAFLILLPLGIFTISRNKVWSSSEAFWEDITIKAPLKARGWNNLGVAKGEGGKWDAAIVCYKEAIRLDGMYADPWSNLAVAYSTKNEVDLAIDALKTAIRIFPNYPEAYNNLGSFLIMKKDYALAERCFFTALQLRPYYGKAHMNLGRLYLEKGEGEKAYQCFLSSVKGDLDNALGYQILGEACIKMQKYKEGAVAFETAISKGSSNPQTYFNLANCYFMVNDLDKAENIYEKLTQAEPQNSQYIYNLAETKLKRENYVAALDAFNKAKNLPNAIANSHLRIALCLEKLGRTDEAKNYLKQLTNIAGAPDWFKLAANNELNRIGNSKNNSNVRIA
ncbi:MAG: Tetratricopeptide TPR_2 repeat protein [candidate division TM6 bacterium GW2011_GWE2_31_21]|nr:MAG: Tetratricopeptide TPR_2 repeat protein [candidate division TM6 bacterium GW2011_GWE2_31_21]KKP54116.1 MAG: Tetratricopeptide TPR_2 repeat protein [candidate division TM6 bacterium GW2011_GWF2_33_332]